MKYQIRIIVTVFLLSCVFSGPVMSTDSSPERQELIDKLLEAQGVNYLGEQLSQMMIDAARAEFENAELDTESEYFETLSNVIDEVVYEELVLNGELEGLLAQELDGFSVDELTEILTFYNTPVGKRLIEVTPEILEAGISQGAELEQRLGGEIEKRLLARLKKEDVGIDKITPSLTGENVHPTETELMALSKDKCSNTEESTKPLPVYRGPPSYPAIARLYGVEGWVDLNFLIKADGRTQDIKVINASVGSLFNKSAISSVEKYFYCPGKTSKAGEIRIRFEMEKDETAGIVPNEKQSLKTSREKFEFIESEPFGRNLRDYGSKYARKAFAIADDGGDKWRTSWYYGFRTQEEANDQALRTCFAIKTKAKIKADCELLMEGDQLTESFRIHKKLRKLAKSAHKKDYIEKSALEVGLMEYQSRLFAKAMALSESTEGQYYYYIASGWENQVRANSEALKKCNDKKPDDLKNACYLFRVGKYKAEEVPALLSMRGVWEGKLKHQSLGFDADSEVPTELKVMLDNCTAHPEISMVSNDSGELIRLHRQFDIFENSGNVVLSSLENGGEWVETQIWTFIELHEGNAKVQRNRMVSNIDLGFDEELREFGWLGSGNMKRISECE